MQVSYKWNVGFSLIMRNGEVFKNVEKIWANKWGGQDSNYYNHRCIDIYHTDGMEKPCLGKNFIKMR